MKLAEAFNSKDARSAGPFSFVDMCDSTALKEQGEATWMPTIAINDAIRLQEALEDGVEGRLVRFACSIGIAIGTAIRFESPHNDVDYLRRTSRTSPSSRLRDEDGDVSLRSVAPHGPAQADPTADARSRSRLSRFSAELSIEPVERGDYGSHPTLHYRKRRGLRPDAKGGRIFYTLIYNAHHHEGAIQRNHFGSLMTTVGLRH
jgi:hypothetical protein